MARLDSVKSIHDYLDALRAQLQTDGVLVADGDSSHAKLERSAAFRGQSPREEGVQGEETHNLLRSLHVDHAAS